MHLLIVTQNGRRLYLKFNEDQKREACLIVDHEKLKMQFDHLQSKRISNNFELFANQSMPNDDIVNEVFF